uniref:Uncharacterized protein n=1 Tax=Human betaherpesvirus 6 TaxID=10368 RepID=A0A5P9U7Y7_9BETA|nr:hypothetical protein [Human betaherpesvirus 6]
MSLEDSGMKRSKASSSGKSRLSKDTSHLRLSSNISLMDSSTTGSGW